MYQFLLILESESSGYFALGNGIWYSEPWAFHNLQPTLKGELTFSCASRPRTDSQGTSPELPRTVRGECGGYKGDSVSGGWSLENVFRTERGALWAHPRLCAGSVGHRGLVGNMALELCLLPSVFHCWVTWSRRQLTLLGRKSCSHNTESAAGKTAGPGVGSASGGHRMILRGLQFLKSLCKF